MTKDHWHVELFGGLAARRKTVGAEVDAEQVVTRFRSRQTGALLAFLAFHGGRTFTREALIEMLWPGCDERAGRNRLSVALSSLRSELGDVFHAERELVGMRAQILTTDVTLFENALRRAAKEADGAKSHLTQAVALYRGALLPHLDDEWIALQRTRLEETFFARCAASSHCTAKPANGDAPSHRPNAARSSTRRAKSLRATCCAFTWPLGSSKQRAAAAANCSEYSPKHLAPNPKRQRAICCAKWKRAVKNRLQRRHRKRWASSICRCRARAISGARMTKRSFAPGCATPMNDCSAFRERAAAAKRAS